MNGGGGGAEGRDGAGGSGSGSGSAGGSVAGLEGFYAYRNTFDDSSVWVSVPKKCAYTGHWAEREGGSC